LKRFYKDVAVVQGDGGHRIELDGRPVRTPLKRLVAVTSAPLADAIAEEWRSQGEDIDLAGMEMMQLAATAIDRIADERASITNQIAGYGRTDLLCYRADYPEDLAEAQAAAWQPLLDWLEADIGARLVPTVGIAAIEQPGEALDAIARTVEEHDDFSLAVLSVLTSLGGSVVVGLAVTRGHIDGIAAFEASQVDETYQIGKWGLDSEAEIRRENIRREMLAAERFLRLYRAG
jgi:chaperone required for assembly of F1-ATPase